jgi:hypothetical protein
MSRGALNRRSFFLFTAKMRDISYFSLFEPMGVS